MQSIDAGMSSSERAERKRMGDPRTPKGLSKLIRLRCFGFAQHDNKQDWVKANVILRFIDRSGGQQRQPVEVNIRVRIQKKVAIWFDWIFRIRSKRQQRLRPFDKLRVTFKILRVTILWADIGGGASAN